MRFIRSPLISTGIVLLLLGAGNWYGGSSRVRHYQTLVQDQRDRADSESYTEFENLTPEMMASLLAPLRQGIGERQDAETKVDLYRLAAGAGKSLLLAGATLIALGSALARSRRLPSA